METTTTEYTNHPCFGIAARKQFGRLHLPVAPRSNAKVRFTSNARPQPAMMPEEALSWMEQVIDNGMDIDIVGITGPGDPLASPEPVIRTLRMVRETYPDMKLCLTSIGLNGAMHAPELADIGLSHITLLVDAVDPAVAEKLYAWVCPSTKTVSLEEGVRKLLDEQAAAVSAFSKAGITVKVNTTVYPSINAGHVESVAKTVSELGASMMAVVPYIPTEENHEISPTDQGLLSTVRECAAAHINLMPAWDECGESIVGTEMKKPSMGGVTVLPKPTPERPNVAVVSSNGMDVDLHLGHAAQVMIYGPREDGLACLLEVRGAPEPGSGVNRWKQLSSMLSDCFVLLAASAGERPRDVLSRNGISVLITDGGIEGTVDVLYGGGKKGKKKNTI